MIQSLRVNHLIIGTDRRVPVATVAAFYRGLFGFVDLGNFIDSRSQEKGVVVGLDLDAHDHPEVLVPGFHILILPMDSGRLPSPQHFAIEVSREEFDILWARAQTLGLQVRAEAALSAPVATEPGKLEVRPFRYRIFYVLDPAGVNLEINSRTSETP